MILKLEKATAKRILVVDDEPTLVATVKYNLEREGYGVDTAADGETALSRARERRPDLVILDLVSNLRFGIRRGMASFVGTPA
jgi:two-component system alkaline phosphatase synthesis response regulator PhoP